MCNHISQTLPALMKFHEKSGIPFKEDYDFSKFPTDITAGKQRVFAAIAVKYSAEDVIHEMIIRSNWGFIRNELFIFNARFETLRTKPSWRDYVNTGRVLIPADGFYEHRHYVHPAENYSGVALAGLRVPVNSEHSAVVVLTRDATGVVTKVHHRMPVIIPPSNWHNWLSPEVPFEEFTRYAHTSSMLELD